MVEKYRKVRRVASFDSDFKARLKPASFLNWPQEAANVHADYLGVGYDTISTTRKAWVLARTHVVFHSLPAWRDEVTVLSWHKRANGFQYYRDFVLESTEGERLVSATTTWLVIDIDTRKLVRNNDFGEEGILGIDEDVIEAPAPKVAIPRDVEAECVGEREVAAGGDRDDPEPLVGVERVAVQVERDVVRDRQRRVILRRGHVVR